MHNENLFQTNEIAQLEWSRLTEPWEFLYSQYLSSCHLETIHISILGFSVKVEKI